MATLDADDLAAIRLIVQEELANDANANTYVARIDQNISAASGLSVTEHNKLMSLENTNIAEAQVAAKTAAALAAGKRR